MAEAEEESSVGVVLRGEDYAWLSFSGDSIPAYMVQSFLNDCLAHPKIILHKEFEFFRQCLSSVGMKITCNNGIYYENHSDPTFCVELEKQSLSDILHREDFVPHEGAWSSVSRLLIRKKLGLGIWKWDLPKGMLDILRLFTQFFQPRFDALMSDPSMDYFQKFVSEFSVDRGADTEEIWLYEKADEERKARSGYVTPDFNSDEEVIGDFNMYEDSSDDEVLSTSSAEHCDSDFNPKKSSKNSKMSKGKKKIKSKKKLPSREAAVPQSGLKGGSTDVRKPRNLLKISRSRCDGTFKYRSELLKHEGQSHFSSNSFNGPYCDEEDSDIEVLSVFTKQSGSKGSGCKQEVNTNTSKSQSSDSVPKNFINGIKNETAVRYQLREIINSFNLRKSKLKDSKITETEDNINARLKRPRCNLKQPYLI